MPKAQKTLVALGVLLLCTLQCATADTLDARWSLGTGVGALYGNSLGINVGYRATDTVEIFALYGAHRGPGAGVHYHLFGDTNRFFNPRLSMTYGVNGVVTAYNEDRSEDAQEYFNGVSLGAGTRLAMGRSRRNAVNIDAFYRVYDGGYSNRKSELRSQDRLYTQGHHGQMAALGRVLTSFFGYYDLQLSVGYNYRF